jgi:hypothetical protein
MDASRLNDIGFVLKQEIDRIWRPVQAGSRFLTKTKGHYAMVELELLLHQTYLQRLLAMHQQAEKMEV